jgi:hypothetical protein
VAGYFIGDYVKGLEHSESETVIKTSNMTGLLVGSYVHFEDSADIKFWKIPGDTNDIHLFYIAVNPPGLHIRKNFSYQ